MNLRPYQIQAMNDIRRQYATGHRSPVLVANCGWGKSCTAAEISRLSTAKGNRVLVIAHRVELIEQLQDTFDAWGVPSDRCDIMMVQSATRRLDKLPQYDFIICDECFPGNVKVDGKPLKSIKNGDIITSWNHETKSFEEDVVVHVFRRKPAKMCVVKLENGQKIPCTPNHPFFVKGVGYVQAEKLSGGCYVRKNVLQSVWKSDCSGKLHKKPMGQQTAAMETRRNILFKRMFFDILQQNIKRKDVKNKQEVRKRKDEEKQPHEETGNKGESFKKIKRNWSLPKNQVRKWSWNDSSAANAFNCLKIFKSLCRISNFDKICRKIRNSVSNLLQSGYSNSWGDAGNRGGWQEPQFNRKERTGQEKGILFEHLRVESVEVQQQTSDGTFGGLCPDGYVYNIEVEKNHNYFADGVLVHNCHHATCKTYTNIFDHYPHACRLLLTATPERTSGQGLADIADSMVQSVSVRWLIDHGYLAPFEYYAPAELINADQLRTVQGDYDHKQATAMLDKPKIYGSVLENYRKFADGKQAIVFASSIEHSKRVVEAFQAAGYTAAHLDGKTPKNERKRLMDEYRAGQLQIISNYEIISEGVSVDGCECCILLRPTKSTILFLQSSQRCMRYAPGKTAVILDMVGNYQRHGLPDDDREWSLQGRKKRTRQKEQNTIRARVCENCFRTYAGNGRICPYCGHEQPKTQAEIKQDERAELEQITAENCKQKRMEVGRARTREELERIARERGYSRGWVWKQMQIKHITA